MRASGWKREVNRWQAALAISVVTADPAISQGTTQISKQIARLQHELQSQRALIEGQSQRIDQQQREIERLRAQVPVVTGSIEPTRRPEVARPSPPPIVAATPPTPDRPVGNAPQFAEVEQQSGAVPEGMGVLTRAGHLVLEPSLEYTNSSSNRLIFRGIELIPGIQVGLIEAGSADRDTFVATATGRYGLTENLEIEARIPYLARSDRVGSVQQRQDATTQRFHLNENGIGDVEFGLRYQFNRPVGQQPIFVGSFRVKTDTGKSPFSVSFDESGVATGLATGSGFWAVQPGLSFLLPSDPAVIFGGASYLYGIPKNVNRNVGGALVGRVNPGDALSGNIGFGFALNQRFSFSLGYEHTYIFPMRWELDGIANRQSRIQVGSLLFGMSYQLTPRQAFNLGIEVGATQLAPDLSITLRMPLSR